MAQVEIADLTFKRTRTRTYDAQNDPNQAIAALVELICPCGTIVATMATTEPGPGWKLCDGQALLKAEYPRLFAVIGGEFGETATSFTLPDLRGRMPMGSAGSYPLLSTGGAAAITLTADQMPEHSHAITDPGHTHAFTPTPHSHAITDPGHTHAAASVQADVAAATGTADGAQAANTASATTGITIQNASAGGTIATVSTGITVQDSGGGEEIPTLPPYLAVNWMVRT